MPRYIDAHILNDEIKNLRITLAGKEIFCKNAKESMLTIIDGQEAVNLKEIVHGEWICSYPDIEPNPMIMYGICSICGYKQSVSDKLNYCPECGAKMDLKV